MSEFTDQHEQSILALLHTAGEIRDDIAGDLEYLEGRYRPECQENLEKLYLVFSSACENIEEAWRLCGPSFDKIGSMKMDALKTVLTMIFGIVEGMATSLEDGDFDYSDVLNFWEPIKTLPDLMDVIDQLPAAAKAVMDEPAKLEELNAWAKQSFDIPQDDIEQMVENFMDAGVKILCGVAMILKAKQ